MSLSLLQEAEKYVGEVMNASHEREWHFHNMHHVRFVVERCQELSDIYGLSSVEREELFLAAGFMMLVTSKEQPVMSTKAAWYFFHLLNHEK